MPIMKSTDPYSDSNRRSFLQTTISTATVAGCGVCAVEASHTLFPPSSGDVTEPVTFDLKELKIGENKTVIWQNRPIFIYKRSDKDLQNLRDKENIKFLRDPHSLRMQQPLYANNWHRSIDPRFGIYIGICTHFGCIPVFTRHSFAKELNEDTYYYCPCHGSYYDLAGRVSKSSAAPLNLPVPPHSIQEDALKIGENPIGNHYDLSSIEQL